MYVFVCVLGICSQGSKSICGGVDVCVSESACLCEVSAQEDDTKTFGGQRQQGTITMPCKSIVHLTLYHNTKTNLNAFH